MQRTPVPIRTIVLGIILVMLGAGLLLGVLGVIDFSSIISTYWPVILLIVALGELISRNWLNAVVLLVVGTALQLNVLGVVQFNVFILLLSVIIIWIGLNVLFRAYARTELQRDTRGYVKATAIFSGTEKRLESKSFRGASLDAIFGGVKIDLREAKIAEEGAVIDVLVIFGGAQIIAPKDMAIEMRMVSIFGGSEDKRPRVEPKEGAKNILRVQGTILFGGLEIKD